MKEKWSNCTLGEVATIVDSLHQTPSYSPVGYPMVRVTDIKGAFLNLKDTLKVDSKIYEEFSKKHIPKAGDIVMSRVGTYGNTSYVIDNQPFCLGQNTLFIVPNIHPRFLFYVLNSSYVKEQIDSYATGSTQKTISLQSIKAIELLIPESTELRHRIAEILGSLDDKIELNRQMNNTLEQMAQALYSHYFVDNIDSQDLPEGWRMGSVNNIVDIQSGFAFKSDYYSTSGKYPLITIKNVQDSEFIPETTDFLDVVPNGVPNYCHLNDGDILLSLTGNVGRVCLVYGGKYLLNQRVARLYPKQPFLYSFVYCLFRSKNFKELLISIAKGTAQQNLSPIETGQLDCIIPIEEIQSDFHHNTKPIIDKLINNLNESHSLKIIRDTLLPKLISGELITAELQTIEQAL